jgi:uncharacterized membrane protein
MDFITALLGRFHPLVVHLPIGILFLAFLFECLSFKRSYKGLRKTVQPALLWGCIFAIAAAVTGYFLRQEGGYEQVLANRHQNSGIITAVLSLVVYVLRPKVKYWVSNPLRKRQWKLALMIPLIISLLVTGHFGGSLTHGEDYLFAAVSLGAGHSKDPADKIRTIPDVDHAVLYRDVIQPIFEARCYDCHSSRKQKGDLRLDKEEFILRGGKDGLVISDGPADSSSLYKRLLLPLEHEDHMPPNEKPQLSSSEIALIQYWIEGNAPFDKQVAEFQSNAKIAAIVKSMQAVPQQSWVPTENVQAADEKTLQRLNGLGINPMPVAEANNYLMVTFSGHQNITDEQIKSLQDIEKQILWLNLSETRITDQQLEGISRLRNLRVLYLNNTKVSDAGLSKLSVLTELRLLSLVGTAATDQSIGTFQNITKLRNLYVYRTQISSEGIQKLIGSQKDLNIDTGNYTLEKLPTDTIVFKKAAK